MAELSRYVKKRVARVVALQLDLEFDDFTYRKWGGKQRCKSGDWIVNNNGDVYTVDRETFARTYQNVSTGIYQKVVLVWAQVAEQAGQIATKEGLTHYKAGAYLVYNEPDGKDGYAVEAEKFERMYELAD